MDVVLIFGPPTPRLQVGRPFPEIRFALISPRPGTKERAVRHVMGCPQMPPHTGGFTAGGREVVYSTTPSEIDDYAAEQFGEDGWVDCPVCVGASER